MKKVTLLAIESSCDETGVSVVQKEGNSIKTLSELVTSQATIHEKTGGVIPDIAAREHATVIGPMIASAIAQAGIAEGDIDGIAVTIGPGLMPALAVGVQAARTLAYAWSKPIVPVHHIEGHIYSALLSAISYKLEATSLFPSLALIVSGGHTMLIEISDHLTYTILGETLDDAVGEVFDKVARMLSLPYPGGPHVSKLAEQGKQDAYQFPRPMMNSGNLNFSYSGLKTSVLYKIRELGEELSLQQKSDIAASFQEAAIDSLAHKTTQALAQKPYVSLLLAGGVAANAKLQTRMQGVAEKFQIPLLMAPSTLMGDNATMIGQAGVFAFEAGRRKTWKEVDAVARISIEKLTV